MALDSVVEDFVYAFRGRPGIHAVRHPNGSYSPVYEDVDYEAHLAGEQPAGIYLMHEDSTVLCSAADIDNHKDGNPAWVQQTDAVCDVLRDHAVPYVREISQSGTGTHVWTIYDEHVPAPLARRFWRMVSRESGVTLPEIYPRQDRCLEFRLRGIQIPADRSIRRPLPVRPWPALPFLHRFLTILPSGA